MRFWSGSIAKNGEQQPQVEEGGIVDNDGVNNDISPVDIVLH